MPDRPIPSEHETARAAQRAIEGRLAPCIPTRLGQGDDYGLDAFVQHVFPGYPPVRTALLFGLQIKGTAAELVDNHQEQLKVSHLIDWTTAQQPILIAVHSVRTETTRWRFASEIVDELEKANRNWKSQATVSIAFSKEHEHSKGHFHEWLRRSLQHATDTEGGTTRFHRSYRSVLLSEIYHERGFSGQHFKIADKQGGPAVADCVTGMQWVTGEVDEHAVSATRVLAGALLLFDKVYYPVAFTRAVVTVMGSSRFLKLINSNRLIPILNPRNCDLTFAAGADQVGDVYFYESPESDMLGRNLRAVATEFQLPPRFARSVERAVHPVTYSEKDSQELLTVSKDPAIRKLFGLGAVRPQAKEAPWSAERLLRIGHVVKFYSIAEQLRVDVVEFEPGLAQVALARWGSRIRFHRIYQALNELNVALNAAALPDIGLLSGRIGLVKCVDISDSAGGAKFREWFWKTASDAVSASGHFSGEVAKRLKELAREDCPLPQEFLVYETLMNSRSEVLASRPGGEAALIRQRQFSSLRLRQQLDRRFGKIPTGRESCPCTSGLPFQNCCGRVLL